MWWAVGIGALVLVLFICSKLRSASHQRQLVQAGRNQLWTSFNALARSDRFMDRTVDERVWSDPYLLGYAQGSLALMMSFFGKGLSTQQNGMVTIRVLEGLAGERWRDVCEQIEVLNGSGDPEFTRGMTHGSNVAILMANRAGPELLAQPDVQNALRREPEQAALAAGILGPGEVGQSNVAGAVLMQDYMERHRQKAGY